MMLVTSTRGDPVSRNYSAYGCFLLPTMQTRKPKLTKVGWLAGDHTVSGGLQAQASLQIPLEENPHENGYPTFRAGRKGSFSRDSVKCFNKPDLAAASEKKTGLFLPVMPVPVPSCAKRLSKWMAWGTADCPTAGPWHGFCGRAERTDEQLEAFLATVGPRDAPSPQTKWSRFLGGQMGSTQLTPGLTQPARDILVAVTASSCEGRPSGMGPSAPLSAGSHHQRWLWSSTPP